MVNDSLKRCHDLACAKFNTYSKHKCIVLQPDYQIMCRFHIKNPAMTNRMHLSGAKLVLYWGLFDNFFEKTYQFIVVN